MVGRQQFALDCVTFQGDVRKINPASWTERAGDTGPFILAWTAQHSATGPTVEKKVRWRKNRAKDKEKREGTEATHTAIPHVYL